MAMPCPYRRDLHFFPQAAHAMSALPERVALQPLASRWMSIIKQSRDKQNPHLRRVLDLRALHAPPGSNPHALTFSDTHMIYYIGHLHHSARGYTGQCYGTFLDRFSGHMATARAMRRLGQNFYTGNDLHRYMLGSGLSDLFCVPLQKVHFVRSVDPRVDAQNFKTAALDAEDRWAQIMNTLPSRSAHHNSQHRTAYNRCRPRAVQVLPIPGQVVPVAVPQVVVRGESGHFVALHAHPAPSPPDSPPAPPYSPLTPEGSPGSCHPPPPPPGSPPPLVLPDHVPLHFSSDDSDDDYSPSTSESESDSDQDSDAPPAGDAADPRVYGYRNWARRVRGIQRDFVHGRLSLDNLHLLDGFNRRNLLMMLSCLFTLNHSDIGIPEEHQFPLIQVLRAHLFGPQHLDAAHADGCRVPLITLFTSPVFDFLHLESVFQEEALATLVPELLPPHPLICFKYHDSLGSSWFNYCAASRVFSWTDRDQVAGRACGCAQHPDLIPDGHEHIICPLASLVDIYYNIHRHIGLRPYPAPALPLLPEHILPAAAV